MKQISAQEIAFAIRALKKGGVALLPTDSSYGLCTPITSKAGIQRILKLKGRSDGKFTVVAASLKQLQAFFPAAKQPEFIRLAKKVWPGPISLVVSADKSVRVPDYPVLQQIAAKVGQPLIATSANHSSQPAAYSLRQASRQFDLLQLDAVLDAGRLPKHRPSAVVKLTTSGIEILRAGPARANRLLKKLA